MLGALYRTLVPAQFRGQIYRTHIQQFQEGEGRRLTSIQTSLPRVELSQSSIANLRVVIDRTELLGYLPKGCIVAEVGVEAGEFSRQILSITSPKELYLIDCWDSERCTDQLRTTVENRFAQEIRSGQVRTRQGYSVPELAKFPDGFFDWVYLDTDHSYANTVQELDVCKAKVKEGGIITGHDYITWGGLLGNVRYGVLEAVHEFCIRDNWEMIYLTHESHRHLSYALRRVPGGVSGPVH